MRELYLPFNRNYDKVIVMDVRSAELTRYAANCILATKVSFMNWMMENLADLRRAEIEAMRKYVQTLIQIVGQIDFDAKLIVEALELRNNEKKHTFFNKSTSVEIRTVRSLQFDRAPNTADIREAFALALMKILWQVIRALNFDLFKQKLCLAVVLNGWNMFGLTRMSINRCVYYSVSQMIKLESANS